MSYFFFKQQTAYEVSLGLVDSDMCISDSEETVRLVVKTTGAVKELVRFVDALRGDPQIHLLRLVSNKLRDGMEVWLRVRAPKPLRSTLLAMAGVSRVEAEECPESGPETAVLKMSLD